MLVVAGCAEESGTPPDEQADSPEGPPGRFGAPYALSDGPYPDAPAPPPHFEGDTLVMHVSYEGGCEDHSFDLRRERADDTLRLWLYHHPGSEQCSTRVYETVRAPLDAAPSGPTVLLTPDEVAPFVLE